MAGKNDLADYMREEIDAYIAGLPSPKGENIDREALFDALYGAIYEFYAGTSGKGLAAAFDIGVMPEVNGDPIVESGSNSDGKWSRWADGTQMCSNDATWHSEFVSTSNSTSYFWTFPATFDVRPSVCGSVATRVGNVPDVDNVQFGIGGTYNAGTTSVEVWHTSTRDQAFASTLIAMGRWK